MVLDTCPQDASVEVVSQFILVIAMQLSPQKGCDVFCFHRVHCRSYERLVELMKCFAARKDQICGILNLHDAPVHARAKSADNWTQLLAVRIELLVQALDIEAIGDLLGLVEIR